MISKIKCKIAPEEYQEQIDDYYGKNGIIRIWKLAELNAKLTYSIDMDQIELPISGAVQDTHAPKNRPARTGTISFKSFSPQTITTSFSFTPNFLSWIATLSAFCFTLPKIAGRREIEWDTLSISKSCRTQSYHYLYMGISWTWTILVDYNTRIAVDLRTPVSRLRSRYFENFTNKIFYVNFVIELIKRIQNVGTLIDCNCGIQTTCGIKGCPLKTRSELVTMT
ncbi:hypothetical protein HUJ04_004729 [Dendroctonus ponderosae]|nr:hypothetical protein HUJ04_004729 [Dendroctonus ponderosae]